MGIERVLDLEIDFCQRILPSIDPTELLAISFPTKARGFAAWAHQGQSYGGGKPYIFHLDMVVDTLLDFGILDFPMICSAYLHDVVEDTETTIEEVEDEFGQEIASLVAAVSEPPGLNRKERHKVSHPVIRVTPRADVLKLADRIANLNHSISSGDKGFINMYQREFPRFKDSLFNPENKEALPLWERLEALTRIRSFTKVN